MTIEEKVREIMLFEEFPDNEKPDRLHALIPPEQLRQLKDGLAVTEAMQQLRRGTADKETERKLDNSPANPLIQNRREKTPGQNWGEGNLRSLFDISVNFREDS